MLLYCDYVNQNNMNQKYIIIHRFYQGKRYVTQIISDCWYYNLSRYELDDTSEGDRENLPLLILY